MFHYFSNENLSEKNGVSATITMKDWFFLSLLSLFSLIPVVGFIIYIVLWIMIGFRQETAPSIANSIKLGLIVSAVVLVVSFLLVLLGFGSLAMFASLLQ